ncbi:AraC family transcriptional regulator [Flavivirga amylovorans]|uniref:AraC family transcriptional regulator n=1 Tax=Flavivirga amylovorans TaxID=870486 RepID=A0ABT8X5P3_9FLAO|nr:AraC family transcriptional regulator [Flavivirga amylovorans]MDO5989002.1 AraC family transcriptional regulator [Flavivirga amylovorans]
MKLHFIDRSDLKNNTFSVTHHNYPYFLKIWHHHRELELVLSIKSKGTRFVGDSILKFDEGDLVLIGKDLPHMWLNDDEYFEASSKLKAEAIAIHFKQDFLGDHFLSINEMAPISDLIERSMYGIKFLNISPELVHKIKSISSLDGFNRIMSFIDVLNDLAHCETYELLASKGFINSFNKGSHRNLDKAYEYIFNHFKEQITLIDVAKIACMNPSSFSRLFKKVNGKSFSEYLTEVRIGYACKLLMERNKNISKVCYESGFNNISNFNRRFKALMSMSPKVYTQHYKKVKFL